MEIGDRARAGESSVDAAAVATGSRLVGLLAHDVLRFDVDVADREGRDRVVVADGADAA
jgi:hypothetical protein